MLVFRGVGKVKKVEGFDKTKVILGGGFKCFLFSPLFREDFQFDEHMFHRG